MMEATKATALDAVAQPTRRRIATRGHQKSLRDCSGNTYNAKLDEDWEITECEQPTKTSRGEVQYTETERRLVAVRLWGAPKKDAFDAGRSCIVVGCRKWSPGSRLGASLEDVFAYHPERLNELIEQGHIARS